MLRRKRSPILKVIDFGAPQLSLPLAIAVTTTMSVASLSASLVLHCKNDGSSFWWPRLAVSERMRLISLASHACVLTPGADGGAGGDGGGGTNEQHWAR
jgi:hypothetical protein